MNKILFSLFVAGSLVLASQASVSARPCCGGGGGGYAYRDYDRAKVVTLSGTVESLFTSGGRGLHAVLKTDKGNIDVHLGPEYWLKGRISLKKGDAISVTGSRSEFKGKDSLIAREFTRGKDRVELRRDDGTPLWSGGGRR